MAEEIVGWQVSDANVDDREGAFSHVKSPVRGLFTSLEGACEMARLVLDHYLNFDDENWFEDDPEGYAEAQQLRAKLSWDIFIKLAAGQDHAYVEAPNFGVGIWAVYRWDDML